MTTTADLDVFLGYTRSTIVTYALWYLLARSSTTALSAHLKATGITGPAAFARQIVALLPPAP